MKDWIDRALVSQMLEARALPWKESHDTLEGSLFGHRMLRFLFGLLKLECSEEAGQRIEAPPPPNPLILMGWMYMTQFSMYFRWPTLSEDEAMD